MSTSFGVKTVVRVYVQLHVQPTNRESILFAIICSEIV